MTTSVGLYDRDMLESLQPLLERVWSDAPDARALDWWYRGDGNPALLALEHADGKVVGVAAMSRLRMRTVGAEELVAVPLGVATDPDHRGRGVFSRLERANEEAAAPDCRLGVTFPNDASRPIFLSRLGWAPLWSGRVWASPPLPAARRRHEVREVDDVTAEADGLRTPAGAGVVTDARFLDWRYVRSPRDYRLVALDDGARRGLLCLRPRRGRVAVVCHALGDPAAVARLLRATAGRLPRIALVPREYRRAFLRAGFLPTPRSVLVLGKPLAAGASLPSAWRFQLGDFDVF